MTVIKEFQGEYRWLSNFWPCNLSCAGLIYPSVENAYQAAKCLYRTDVPQFTNLTPGQAKRLSREIEIRPDWEDAKVGVMRELLAIKFGPLHPKLRQMLLDTGDAELQEGNRWHDTYWGVDLTTGKGQNNLGKLLMQIRKEIRNEQ